MRKQPVGPRNDWNFDLEPGDRVYTTVNGVTVMYDLYESNGFWKSAAGELSIRIVKKHGKVRVAVQDDNGVWYWKD